MPDDNLSVDVWACDDPECGLVHVIFWSGKKREFSCSLDPDDIATVAERLTREADLCKSRRLASAGELN